MNRVILWMVHAREAVSIIVLSVLYFAIVTPYAWGVALFRDDPLTRGFDAERESYWEPREPEPAGTLWGFFIGRGKGWMLPLVALLLGIGALVLVTEGSMIFAFLYPLF